MDVREVRWSSRAEQDFDDQINYLIQNWSVKTAERFIDQVQGVVDAIARHPFQYPAWQDDVSIRKCVVNQHIALFYQVEDEQIVLLTFSLPVKTRTSWIFPNKRSGLMMGNLSKLYLKHKSLRWKPSSNQSNIST